MYLGTRCIICQATLGRNSKPPTCIWWFDSQFQKFQRPIFQLTRMWQRETPMKHPFSPQKFWLSGDIGWLANHRSVGQPRGSKSIPSDAAFLLMETLGAERVSTRCHVRICFSKSEVSIHDLEKNTLHGVEEFVLYTFQKQKESGMNCYSADSDFRMVPPSFVQSRMCAPSPSDILASRRAQPCGIDDFKSPQLHTFRVHLGHC